jgi:VWFA-related protein
MRPSRRLRTGAAVGVALVLLGGDAPGAGAPPPVPQTDVAIEFYALDKDGRALPDLRADEVTVRLMGRARPIKALRLVEAARPPAAGASAADAAPRPEPPPPPFATNALPDDGRAILLIIDDESFRQGREPAVRAALQRLLSVLDDRDRVTLITMPHGGVKVDFTTRRDLVAAAVQQIVGHGPEQETGSDASCRSRLVLESLEATLDSLAGGRGPTTVVFLSASLLPPRRDALTTEPPGPCEIQQQAFTRVGEAAARARAHFFVVRAEELGSVRRSAAEMSIGGDPRGSTNPLEGLEHLAGVTGGLRLTLAVAKDDTLVRIAQETAAYYVATIEASAAEMNNVLRTLDVRVSRRDTDVRARPQFHFPPAASLPPPRRTPVEMLKSDRAFRALELRATAYVSRAPGGRIQVIAAAQPADPGATLEAFSAGLFDRAGKLVSQWNARASDLVSSPLLSAMVVPQGTYRLRVAGTDSAGRSGATDQEVVAELATAGALSLSSLVVGLSREGGFQPRLQFSTEPVALAYLEIYGGAAGAKVGALIEIATTLNGPALQQVRLSIEATSDPGRFMATGAVPLGALPPGDYVIRAIIGVENQPAGRVVRTIRKT